MSAFFQSNVIFSKWLDSIYPSKELSKEFLHTLHIKSEANLAISTKKTLSEQINDRIFLSSGAYYVVTLMMLYALLTRTYMFFCASEMYLNHPLQQNALSDFIRKLGENRNELFTVVIAFLIYPFINFFSRVPFKLIISALKSMSFMFTEMNVQQIRIGTCVSLSALLVLGIIYCVF